MNTWIWVLSFTVLGPTAEHGTISKHTTRQECEQTLEQLKQEKKAQNKTLVGSCRMTLKETTK